MRTAGMLTIVVALASLTGCAADQAYSAAQGWQRNQCNRFPDKADFDRCMAQSSNDYGAYRRQSGQLSGAP